MSKVGTYNRVVNLTAQVRRLYLHYESMDQPVIAKDFSRIVESLEVIAKESLDE